MNCVTVAQFALGTIEWPSGTDVRLLRINIVNIDILLKGARGMASIIGPVENTIRSKLQNALEAKHLYVINESYMHNVPKGSETHFVVFIVSQKFVGQSLIKRHRLVNNILRDELSTGVHALSIVAQTPEQWEENGLTVKSSPKCMGGFGK